MAFLRDAWYSAGFSDELRGGAFSRKLLGEPVLLYRTDGGEVVALSNRCPHRFAPLHVGKRVGDGIQCPYHGLVFARDGRCVENPGALEPPKQASVKAYPLVERHGILWIWMGDPREADDGTIPDFSEQSHRPGWTVVTGQLFVPVNYQLITDNLLDLSHVAFLHQFLSSADSDKRETRADQSNGTVWHRNRKPDSKASPLFLALLEGNRSDHGDLVSEMRWDAPANMFLKNIFTPQDHDPTEICMHMAHLLTPETESSTHYFWTSARNTHLEDAAFSEKLNSQIQNAFENEDEPMIVACESMMEGKDLMSLRPIILPGDGAAIRARRLLAKRLRETQKKA